MLNFFSTQISTPIKNLIKTYIINPPINYIKNKLAALDDFHRGMINEAVGYAEWAEREQLYDENRENMLRIQTTKNELANRIREHNPINVPNRVKLQQFFNLDLTFRGENEFQHYARLAKNSNAISWLNKKLVKAPSQEANYMDNKINDLEIRGNVPARISKPNYFNPR